MRARHSTRRGPPVGATSISCACGDNSAAARACNCAGRLGETGSRVAPRSATLDTAICHQAIRWRGCGRESSEPSACLPNGVETAASSQSAQWHARRGLEFERERAHREALRSAMRQHHIKGHAKLWSLTAQSDNRDQRSRDTSAAVFVMLLRPTPRRASVHPVEACEVGRFESTDR